jgi:hypothetical protein
MYNLEGKKRGNVQGFCFKSARNFTVAATSIAVKKIACGADLHRPHPFRSKPCFHP